MLDFRFGHLSIFFNSAPPPDDSSATDTDQSTTSSIVLPNYNTRSSSRSRYSNNSTPSN